MSGKYLIKDLVEELLKLDQESELKFVCTVESGRGYVGDSDCTYNIVEDEEEDNLINIRVDGDKQSETGYYE